MSEGLASCIPHSAHVRVLTTGSACGATVNKRCAVQMRRFEKLGMTRQQAEAMTEHLTGLLCLHTEKLAEQYVSKAALEKVRSATHQVPGIRDRD